MQSIWVQRTLTDSSDEVLYPPIEEESYTKVWEASVPPSPNPNPKSTKAINGFVFDIVNGIDIQANYTIEAEIVLCSDKNEPTADTVIAQFSINNTTLSIEGLPSLIENRAESIYIQNLSKVDFSLSRVVGNVPKYEITFSGIQNVDIQIEFPLKVSAVAETYTFEVYYFDGTNFTKIQAQNTQSNTNLYQVNDANLENTNSQIIIVRDGDDPTDDNNCICELRKNGFWADDGIFKIYDYSQYIDTAEITYALYGYYGSFTPFTLKMTNKDK